MTLLFGQEKIVDKSADNLFNKIRTFDLGGVDSSLFFNKSSRELFLLNSFRQLVAGESYYIEDMLYPKDGPKEDFFYLLLKGDISIEENRTIKSDSIAYAAYLKAYHIANEKNDIILKCESLKRILKYHFKAKEDVMTFHDYAKTYRELAYDLHEKLYAEYYYFGSAIGIIYDFKRLDLKPLPKALKALALAESNSKYYLAGRLSQLIGVYYDIIINNKAKARFYYKKAINHYKAIPYYFAQKNRNDLSYNLGSLELDDKNFYLALDYLNKINHKAIPKRDEQDKILIYKNYYSVYFNLGVMDSALYYLQKKSVLQDSLNLILRAKDVKDIQTKYETAEKEKQILEEQQKVRANRNWLIAACLALLFGTGIAVLFQKNTTKKRLLAEQEALLKQERVDNLLKEQELVSIDAMIAGQEKERQRVANELHDDLGSLMATIKLHFDNSKVSKKDPALQNAQKLLEEAYQKVRSMAHSKNSGVMSDQGLLPAIKKMAQVITETNALEVVVEDFGMGDRLENSLELNLFRMVQELVANTIKHAEASKVSIQLTQHKDTLNIIIEDNGKGFDRTKIDTSKTGMGLTTIEKRVEHLEGNFTVDSVLGKGTSILIDIPV
ncbi:sensor histidine kinase [Croceitalea marina]|uniref:Oxygen sensor histidine kinase NreB n=1 Tax=Croceitalea marina TaxID=1775166 RepID=A0ABW5MX20_9FLAO